MTTNSAKKINYIINIDSYKHKHYQYDDGEVY